ncbi:MAG: hypothetical protein ACK4XJ_07810 [Fimbriimonadaceae bacterium]
MDWLKSLQELRQELALHEGYPCITLTMPTARTMPDNAQDPVRLKNLVTEAKRRMEQEIGKRPSAQAMRNLETAAESVDHNRNYEGLAIFASDALDIVLKTRFHLPESVNVDDKFSLRAILRAERRAEPYSVLVMSLDEARLYEGMREDLAEVRHGGFPNQNAAAGAGSKVPSGPGVNATAAVDESRRRFVKDSLDKFAAMEDLSPKLVITGTPEVLSAAEGQMPHRVELLAAMRGNFIGDNLADLGKKVWEQVRARRREMSMALVESLSQAQSAQRYESGIQSLAPLADQGRIDTLVCAMEYQQAGRWDPATGSMQLIDTPETMRDADDAVEWIVHRVLETGGEVRFVEDELLGDVPIRAILRY